MKTALQMRFDKVIRFSIIMPKNLSKGIKAKSFHEQVFLEE